MKKSTIAALSTSALLAGMASTAHADIFRYSTGGQYTPVGTLASLTTSYNNVNRDFEFDFRIADNQDDNGNPIVNDSFWLVVTDGPLPTAGGTETVIFYGDADDANDIRLTAYKYDDNLNARSYRDPSNFIGNFTSNFSFAREVVPIFSTPREVSHFNIDLNVAGINSLFPNNPAWDGIQFGPEVGIWLRMFDGAWSYNGDQVADFSIPTGIDNRGYFDRGHLATRVTETVPEPGALALVGLGLAGLVAKRRRKVEVA